MFLRMVKAKYLVMSINEVTIPAGAHLFHGTIEDFSTDLKGGGYDNIIWFSDSPKIAQLYIPKAGSKLFISPDSIARPSKDNDIQILQRELGIEYDYSDIKWERNTATSFKLAKGWNHVPKDVEIDKLMDDAGYEKRKHFSDPYVLRRHNGKFLKKDEVAKGRLFIARVKSPLKIWNKASGRDGDLMNLEYHDLKGFGKAKEAGFDGVLINDFAQSEEHGNFGHMSVGLFDIKKLEIKQVPAQYREWDYKAKGTPEYPNAPEIFLHNL